jgi:hypothetical protein
MANKSGKTGSTDAGLKLQTNYGLALTFSQGAEAEETKAASARTEQLSMKVKNADARLSVYPMQFIANVRGGQMRSALSIAELYLKEASSTGSSAEIALANILLGEVRMFQGAFRNARAHLDAGRLNYERELAIERESAYGVDWGSSERSYLRSSAGPWERSNSRGN